MARNPSLYCALRHTFLSSLVDVNEPDREPENDQRGGQCPPKEGVLAQDAQIDEDHPQSVKPMQQEAEQQRNIDGRVEVNLPARPEKLGEGHFVLGRPAGVNLDWDQQEQTDRADALREPRPGAAIILEALFHYDAPTGRRSALTFCRAWSCASMKRSRQVASTSS